jgi:hypothetical protein
VNDVDEEVAYRLRRTAVACLVNAPAFATAESNARKNAPQVDSGATQVGEGVAKNESGSLVGRWHWNRAT